MRKRCPSVHAPAALTRWLLGGDGHTPSALALVSSSAARFSLRHVHSGAPASTRSRQRGQHAQSRRAGRAAAQASPLSHNQHVPHSQFTATTSAQEGAEQSRAPPTSSMRFGSTRLERHFDPSAIARTDQRSGGEEDVSSGNAPSGKERRTGVPSSSSPGASAPGAAAAAPVLAPYSALAYRARLVHGHVHSIVELAHAPYAPRRLQVLLDVLELLKGGERSGAVADRAGGDGDGGGLARRAGARNRLQAAISRTADVRILLDEVVNEVEEVVQTAEQLSDRESARELHEVVAEVERFVNALTAARPSPTSDTHASDAWQLPLAVYAEALHGALRMTRHLSTYKTALVVLEELLTLDEARRAEAITATRAEEAGALLETNDKAEEGGSFTLDAIVSVVEADVNEAVRPISAADHLLAMESCAAGGEFTVALMLYKRLVQHAQMGYVPVTVESFERGLIALAMSVRNAVQFAELQELLIESEVAQSVPVTVALYTALIDAVSRADENEERMSIALALYRRLRDGALTPSVETYSALMACCASCKEPTHAFAFYHEACALCGTSSLTPAIYTNLLLAYTNAGYGTDARRTLDVLVEAGAPLTRTAFHAVLAGAVTLREAKEVFEAMTGIYHIPATPHTYAFLIQSAAKMPRGVSTALQIFDFHEAALLALADMLPAQTADTSSQQQLEGTAFGENDGGTVALSTSAGSERLEAVLLERYPQYVQVIAHALMKLRIDPRMDARLNAYVKPLVRLAQRQMNAFNGGMPPQAPTLVPPGASTCVAVLAPDVLAHIDDLVEPFMSYYTAAVIPYTSLLALSVGGARRRVDGVSVRGVGAGLHDEAWQAAGSEHGAVIEHRRQRLLRFLEKYRSAVHLVSLEEELAWSRDVARYGVAVKNWPARSAALAIQLARRDVPHGFRLYAEAGATVVLVSTDYERCGRYVVDLKRQYSRAGAGEAQGHVDEPFAGLREGLSRVLFHNPRTQPQWSPPSLSAADVRETENVKGDTCSSSADAGDEVNDMATPVTRPADRFVKAVDERAAADLYRRLVSVVDAPRKGTTATVSSATPAVGVVEPSSTPRADNPLDAALLLELMNS